MLRLQDVIGRRVGDLPAQGCEHHPDAVAMVWRDEQVSWRDLDDTTARVASGLARLGVGSGDRVAIVLPNRPEVVYAYFAVARLGAVVVPVNPALTGPELGYVLADSGAGAVVVSRQHAAAVAELRRDGPAAGLHAVVSVDDDAGTTPYEEVRAAPPLPASAPRPDLHDPVVIYYTSGTTGRPKGAVHTHFSVLATALSAGRMMTLTRNDRVLLCTPLYHSAAMHTFLMSHALVGASWVVTPGFDATAVLDTITHDRVTIYFGVVPMLIATLEVGDLATRDLSSLRILFTGASPVPDALKRRCIEAFPGVDLIDGYGCTESGPAGTALHARDALDHPGSVGTPWPYLQAGVLDTTTHQPVGPGQVGEVVLRGPTEMLGYHRLADATAAAFADGWLHTGDLGHLDADGFLYVTGRVKDMLIRGGVNIYPRETEEVLYTHPAVAEAAVFGVPDDRMGEEVMATVALRPGARATPEELVAHCAGSLAPFKLPCYLQVVEEFPRNATGKILKYRLQQAYADPASRGPRLRRRDAAIAERP